jgi:ElaA protein
VQIRHAQSNVLTPGELYELLRLRSDVFVVEQRCAYQDLDRRDLEATTWHVWARADDELLAYLRVTDEAGLPRIGRVCTRRDQRGRGLAGQLMRYALSRLAGQTVVLYAQAHLETYYQSFGFSRSGANFLEDGIDHVPMRR